LLDFGLLDVLDVRLSGKEHLHFFRVGIKPGDFVSRFGEAQRQGQAHIAASDDSYFELGALEKLRFSVRWHDVKLAPQFCLLGVTAALKRYGRGAYPL
jgi:hypothetical protein